MPPSSRILRAFVLHGRSAGQPMDYEDFFGWIGSLPGSTTRVELGQDLVLAIAKAIEAEDGRWHFRFISGNPREIPLLYVEATGETVTEKSIEGTWRAVATRVTVDPSRRLVAVELRRAGVGATNLERYFSRLAIQNNYGQRVTLEMNPLPSPSFEEELEELVRIREAAIEVRRPNTDWNDADDVLSDLADESGAHRASLTVNAGRGESLARRQGIMSLVLEHLRRPLSNVQNVRVTGSTAGSDRERTVSLAKHQLQAQATVPPQASLSEEDETLFEAEDGLLERGVDVVADLADLRPDEVLE